MASKVDEKEMTFSPKINNRPAFLGPRKLVNVSAYNSNYSYSNDPMEMPLPGKNNYQSNDPLPDLNSNMYDRQGTFGSSKRGGQTTAPLTPLTPVTDSHISELPYLTQNMTIGVSSSVPKSRLSLLKSKLRQSSDASMSQKISSSGPMNDNISRSNDASNTGLSRGSYTYQSSPALLASPSSGLALSVSNTNMTSFPSGGHFLSRRPSPATSQPVSVSSIKEQVRAHNHGQSNGHNHSNFKKSIPSLEYGIGSVSETSTLVKQLFSSSYLLSSPETVTPPHVQKNLFEEVDTAIEGYSELSECTECGRKFNPTAYEKHIKVCKKVFLSQRKVFDSKKMRIQDNPELVKILTQKEREEAKVKGKSKAINENLKSSSTRTPILSTNVRDNQVIKTDTGQQSKWKADSELFRQMMKNARDTSKAIAEGKPLPPPVTSVPDPSLVPCPHCGRSFNPKAADRHIPQCVNIRAKPTSLRRGDGKNGLMGAGTVSTLRTSRKLYY